MLLRILFIALFANVIGGAAEFKFTNQTLTLPAGFEIELVAGPPLVDRPIVADFDEVGRLYVADSSGSNDKAQKQLEDKPHRIVRLEDTDGDGRFDKSVVFADKMMFPEGTMWLDGSLYVAAPPSIWKLTDTDGDGVADERSEWFQGKTLTGCANDLHGPYRGPDGWIYWAKGAFAKQTYERPGKSPFVTRAAHIFRCRPDGSSIEPVMTGGMDNPVDVVFTPGGERIFTTTFFQQPAGGKRDGLIHAVYGGVYGKVNDVNDDHKKTGDLMPVLTHLGPAAPCGLTRYESRVFGAEYQDSLFACLFNLHKVTRHVLEPSGATYKTRDEDFVVSDSTDFHPTDVIEDADGSLLVVDTGGWYKLCCPTSQLWKPDVLGAIYRVRRKGAPPVKDPYGLTKISRDLAELLGDQRPVVQRREMELLAKMQAKAVPVLAHYLKTSKSVLARRNAVWTLTRINGDKAREAVRIALHDADSTVQQAALHSCSLWRDAVAVPELIKLLKDRDLQLRRIAAEALGRISDAKAVPALLSASASKSDRFLEHSLTYALIEIGNRDATLAGLSADNARTRKAALIALDQMDNGGLTPAQVIPLLESKDPILKETAFWVIGHHADWGDALADYFRRRLKDNPSSDLQRALAQLARNAAIQELLASIANDSSVAKSVRIDALKAMAQSGLKESPESWVNALVAILGSGDPDLVTQSVSTVRAVSINKQHTAQVSEALEKIACKQDLPPMTRLEAAAQGGKLNDGLFQFVCSHVLPDQPVADRTAAANALAKGKLNNEQLLALADKTRSIGPLELTRVLGAFESSTNEEIGLRLIASLKQNKSISSVHPDTFKSRLAKYPPAVQKEADALVETLNADAQKQKAQLEQLLANIHDGDVRRGQAIFNSPKAACASCHAIGYLGGNIGPDLTKIGQVRTERDLLEAVVYPSASFVRSYEPVIVTTKSGEDQSGVVRKDAPDEVVLATGPATEIRIARSEIQEMRPGTVSIMPQGLDQQLTKQELADLIAFLKATRW